MLTKILLSLGIGVGTVYLIFCLVLLNPIATEGEIKNISKGIKHKWFWTLSVWVGKIVFAGIVLMIIVGIPYIIIFTL